MNHEKYLSFPFSPLIDAASESGSEAGAMKTERIHFINFYYVKYEPNIHNLSIICREARISLRPIHTHADYVLHNKRYFSISISSSDDWRTFFLPLLPSSAVCNRVHALAANTTRLDHYILNILNYSQNNKFVSIRSTIICIMCTKFDETKPKTNNLTSKNANGERR